LAAARPNSLPEKILLAQHAMPHVLTMLVGPVTGRDHLWLAEQQGSHAVGVGSSAAKHHVAFSVASRENKGIGVVVDLQQNSSPTAVMRQFSRTPKE
jgi:hypothetical protein